MKVQSVCILTLLAGASAIYAQGTVSIANYAALNPYIYVVYKAGVYIGGSSAGPSPTLQNYALEIGNGNDWSVQLYAAPGLNATTLSPVPGAIVTLGTTPATAGTWAIGGTAAVVNLPGTTGGATGTATFQLYAWYNAGGLVSSYEAALADGVPTAFSAVADISGLGGGSPPATAPPLPESLGNIYFTPEPGTIALGVMGATTFIMRLRRK